MQRKQFCSYSWAVGSIHKVSAETAADVLEQLEIEGRLTAADLVDVSRPEDAPLHKEFEWDDAVAAEKFREEQARSVIRHLRIVYEEEEPHRVYCNIERGEANYIPIEKAVQQDDTRKKLLDNAYRELEAFKEKYEELSEMARVITVVDEVLEERKRETA